MATLEQAAARSGYPFEVGPSGRWLRFEGKGADIFVMGDMRKKKFTVITTGGTEMCEIAHYGRAEEAIAAAVARLAG